MKPAAFRYHRPSTLEAALALLAEHGDAARPIAGGQSLVPMMNLRLVQPAELVDLASLPGLDVIRESGDGLEVGALVRHHVLEGSERVAARVPLLAQAAATIGHYAIRQRGTIGGSIAHADPAAQLPLVAATLGASIEVASVRGRRVVPAREFFVAVMTTALAPDEVIVGLRFPLAADGEVAAFRAFARRQGDFSIVAAAVTLRRVDGRVGGLRLGVGGAGPIPVVFDALAAAQRGRVPDARWQADVAREVAHSVDLQDDLRIPAVYRRELIQTLVGRALGDALHRTEAVR